MNKIILKDSNGLPKIVFHGTVLSYYDSLKQGIDLKRSNDYLDFGKGFYTTSDYKQAFKFAKTRTIRYNNLEDRKHSLNNKYIPQYTKPLIVHYLLDIEGLLRLNRLIFNKPDDNWKEFVYNNRRGINHIISSNHNLDNKYDFVYGSVADSDAKKIIENAIESYREIEPHFFDQMSFHTEESLLYIHRFGEGEVYEENII